MTGVLIDRLGQTVSETGSGSLICLRDRDVTTLKVCQNKVQVITRNQNIEEGGLGIGYDEQSTGPEVRWERNKTCANKCWREQNIEESLT